MKCQITQFKFCMFSKIDSHCLRLHGIELLNKQRLISDANTHVAIDYLNIQMKSLGRNNFSRKIFFLEFKISNKQLFCTRKCFTNDFTGTCY